MCSVPPFVPPFVPPSVQLRVCSDIWSAIHTQVYSAIYSVQCSDICSAKKCPDIVFLTRFPLICCAICSAIFPTIWSSSFVLPASPSRLFFVQQFVPTYPRSVLLLSRRIFCPAFFCSAIYPPAILFNRSALCPAVFFCAAHFFCFPPPPVSTPIAERFCAAWSTPFGREQFPTYTARASWGSSRYKKKIDHETKTTTELYNYTTKQLNN